MLSQPEPQLVVFSNNLRAVLRLQHIVVFPEISRIQNLVASFCLSDGHKIIYRLFFLNKSQIFIDLTRSIKL
jgi:hypothetical protein